MRTLPGWLAPGLLLAACSTQIQPPAAQAPQDGWSLESARILFNGREQAASELYVHDLSSGETTRVTRMAERGHGANGAAVSPDGSQLVFQATRPGDYDLYVQALAGAEPRPFEIHPSYEVLPQWSPDGSAIAFMSTRGVERGAFGPFPGHLYIKRLEGGAMRRITVTPLSSSLGPSDWSADGASLLLARKIDGSLDVFRLDIESGNETRITRDPADEYSASFSSDGQRVAFHAEFDSESHIVVSNTDGSNRRQLTSGPGLRYYPRWSPDDQWLIFTASKDGKQYDIHAVPVSGGDERVLLATSMDEREARFLP